jgi:hypothetical protein
VLGGIAGLFFGVFLDGFLAFRSTRATDSIWLIVLPAAGLVLGVVWGLAGPLGRADRPATVAATEPPA